MTIDDRNKYDTSVELHSLALQQAVAAYTMLSDPDFRGENQPMPTEELVANVIDQYIMNARVGSSTVHGIKVIAGGVEGYEPLARVLSEAYDQSSRGKGKERHANARPFLRQPIMEIGRMVGTGYQIGQVMKKVQEAKGMADRGNYQAAKAELLGAIVYSAAAFMLLDEQENSP